MRFCYFDQFRPFNTIGYQTCASKSNKFDSLLLTLSVLIESIETGPSTVMFVTYAWTNVLKENISADLIRDMMNAVYVSR